MQKSADLLHARGAMPRGTFAVGGGLLVLGASSYGFLVLAARALGPDRYSGLSALWVLVFTAGPGLFLPLEQEVGRALATRAARNEGGGPLLRRAAALGGLLVAGVLLLAAVAAGPLRERLFDGDVLLLVAFCVSAVAFWVAHLARGALAGQQRFKAYGGELALEGLLRVIGCAVLAMTAVGTAGPYGLVLAAAPIVACLLLARGARGALAPGPEAPWREVSGALGLLLLGSVASQLLVNAGPLAVKALAGPAEQELAGRFLNGLVVARVPLFLFAAVQAALLPRLAALAGGGSRAAFVAALRRLLRAVAVLGATGTAVAVAVGPAVVVLLFGEAYLLGARDLGLLAAASGVYMLALVLGQALVALRGYGAQALGWVAGAATLFAVVAVGDDLLLRAELGFLVGAIASTGVMAALLLRRLRGPLPADGGTTRFQPAAVDQ